MTTVVDSEITYDMGAFIGQDNELEFTIYVRGTTQAQIDANTAVKEDLTGAELLWRMRLTRSNPTVLIEKVSTGISPGIVINPDQIGHKGECTVTLDRVNTVPDVVPTIKGGTYYHGLARTNTGSYDVIADGPIRLRRSAVS